MPPLTQKQLDAAKCQVPGCTHDDHKEIAFHSRCHPTQGTTAVYMRGTGVLCLYCKECGSMLCELKLAKE